MTPAYLETGETLTGNLWHKSMWLIISFCGIFHSKNKGKKGCWFDVLLTCLQTDVFSLAKYGEEFASNKMSG